MRNSVKWVGFDMDECVGVTHYLYPFAHEFLKRDTSKFMHTSLTALAKSEMRRHTGYIRPALFPVLEEVYKQWKSGQIAGAFMYSNNSSHALVDMIHQLLNTIIGLQQSLPHPPSVLQMAVSGQTPERPSSFVKDWAGVVACLKSNGLTPPTSKNDLLFYDDMPHVLERQISHYCRVPKYTYVTPQKIFIALITPLVPPDLTSRWSSVKHELTSLEHSSSSDIPTSDKGLVPMVQAIRAFGSVHAHQTRKHPRKQRGTRKIRRHG
jgi:hypothetical protein